MSDQNDAGFEAQSRKKIGRSNYIKATTLTIINILSHILCFISSRFSAILSILSFLVSVITLYRVEFWKPDDLVVYFRFQEPTQIGKERLNINFIFSNSGKNTVFIEDVGVIQVLDHIIPNNLLGPEFNVCKEKMVLPPGFLALIPPKQRHAPIVDANNGRVSTFYTPSSIYIDGVISQFSSMSIDPGKQHAISATFDTQLIDFSKYNVVLLCPTISFFDASGNPHTAICGGSQTDDVYSANDVRAKARRLSTAPGPARLLPTSTTNCLIAPL